MIERFITWRLKRAIHGNNLKSLNWWLHFLGVDTANNNDWPSYGNIQYAELFKQCLEKSDKKSRTNRLAQQSALRALQDIFLNKIEYSQKANIALEHSLFIHKPIVNFKEFAPPLGRVSRFFSKIFKRLFDTKIKAQTFSTTDIRKLIEEQYPVVTPAEDEKEKKHIAREDIPENQHIQDLFSIQNIDYEPLKDFPSHSEAQSTLMEIQHDVVVEHHEVVQMEEVAVEAVAAELEMEWQISSQRDEFVAIDKEVLIKQIRETGYRCPIEWISGICNGIEAAYPKATLEISKKAGEQIKNSQHALVSALRTAADMNTLPAGFFWRIPEDTSEKCVIRLDYSEKKYLLDVKRAKEEGVFILDILEKSQPETYDTLVYKTTEETASKIKEKYPKLEFNLPLFLGKSRKAETQGKSVVDNFLWYACDSLSKESFEETVRLLKELEEVEIILFDKRVPASYVMLRGFFRPVKAPNVFDEESFSLLEAFLQLNKEETRFFIEACKHSGFGSKTEDFKKNLKKYFSLIKLLHDNDLSIDELSKFGRVDSLDITMKLTNFFYGIKDTRVQAEVLKNIERLPQNLGLASTWLKIGYQFVDKDMFCDYNNLSYGQDYISFELFNELCAAQGISTAFIDQTSVEKFIAAVGNSQACWDTLRGNNWTEITNAYKKAILLRYLAFNTNFSHKESLDLLKKIPSTSDELAEFFKIANKRLRLSEQEPVLDEGEDFLKTGDKLLKYDTPDDLEKIFDALEMQENTENKKKKKEEILEFLSKLQTQLEAVRGLDGQSLQAALRSLKTKPEATLEEGLALLVETNRRLSAKKIELRLEQIIEIYMGYHYPSLNQIHTSEGKTFIIGFTAVLRALLHKEKVDVITNNDYLAEDNALKIQRLAQLCGLSVNHCKHGYDTECDIFYTSVDKQVGHYLQYEAPKEGKGVRQAKTILVDEVDHVLINFQADTEVKIGEEIDLTEVQQKKYHEFLDALISIVDAHPETNDADLQTAFNKKHGNRFEEFFGEPFDQSLVVWIESAKSAKSKKIDEDYVVKCTTGNEIHSVVLVHHATSGRLDERSKWSKGVHALVAYRHAKEKNRKMLIPAPSKTIASATVYQSLAKYEHRVGYSGTLGTTEFIEIMQSQIATESCKKPMVCKYPRAKRNFKGEATSTWPKKTVQGKQEMDYLRRFDFAPRYFDTKEAHFLHILKMVQEAQQRNLSVLLFFKTIKACEVVKTFLMKNGLDGSNIQIYDDNPGDPFRPTEGELITHAKEPGKVTIATAAGSRGTDFDGVDLAIICESGLETVVEQQQSRTGRDGELGVTYQLYHQKIEQIQQVERLSESPALVSDIQTPRKAPKVSFTAKHPAHQKEQDALHKKYSDRVKKRTRPQ